jgi:hypothetical protein
MLVILARAPPWDRFEDRGGNRDRPGESNAQIRRRGPIR